jgi:hypothetical protein
MKRLADRIDPSLFVDQRREHSVTPAKALDNAIVNYVRITARRMIRRPGRRPCLHFGSGEHLSKFDP